MHDRCRIADFHQNQEGGAYTLSYVMIIPLIIVLCCLVCETCLMLMAKMGTVYASYAAVRTAVVQYSSQEDSLVEAAIEQAAKQAMVPFASGMADSGSDANRTEAEQFVEAFQEQFPESRASQEYLLAKCRYAGNSITVSSSGPPGNWEDDIEVSVTYKYPYAFGLMGKLFGAERDGDHYVRVMTSTSRLQSESPRNEDQRLGIRYASP